MVLYRSLRLSKVYFQGICSKYTPACEGVGGLQVTCIRRKGALLTALPTDLGSGLGSCSGAFICTTNLSIAPLQEGTRTSMPMDQRLLHSEESTDCSRKLRIRTQRDRVPRHPTGIASITITLYLLQLRPGRKNDRQRRRSHRLCRRL